jgi:hypothetical protein
MYVHILIYKTRPRICINDANIRNNVSTWDSKFCRQRNREKNLRLGGLKQEDLDFSVGVPCSQEEYFREEVVLCDWHHKMEACRNMEVKFNADFIMALRWKMVVTSTHPSLSVRKRRCQKEYNFRLHFKTKLLSYISGLRDLQNGVWIWWTNLLDVYTTCHNISQITIFDWTLSTSDNTTLIHNVL